MIKYLGFIGFVSQSDTLRDLFLTIQQNRTFPRNFVSIASLSFITTLQAIAEGLADGAHRQDEHRH
jgi:hypothetical protein